MIEKMIRAINLRLDGHKDLRAFIDEINAQITREAEREASSEQENMLSDVDVSAPAVDPNSFRDIISVQEFLNDFDDLDIPQEGWDLDFVENSQDTASQWGVKFKGNKRYFVLPLRTDSPLLQPFLFFLFKGKRVQPVKITCGKLRIVMECIDTLLDELFEDMPYGIEHEPSQCEVSNAQLKGYMKELFRRFKESMLLLNHDGIVSYVII